LSESLPPTVILLVDDDAAVQTIIQAALEDAGYQVLTASSGAEAKVILEREAADLGGMITDVNLGSQPNGWKVGAAARELNAGLPVIYVSGDSAHEWAAHGVPNSLMITKPFTPTELVVALATLRNQAPPPT